MLKDNFKIFEKQNKTFQNHFLILKKIKSCKRMSTIFTFEYYKLNLPLWVLK